MRDAIIVNPIAKLLVHAEILRRNRWDRQAAACRGLFVPFGLERGGPIVAHRLAVRGHEAIENDERADPLGHLVGDTRDDHAAIGVADEYDAGEILGADKPANILDMGREIHRLVAEMRTLAKARQPGP